MLRLLGMNTLLEYFVFRLSSIASALGFSRSSGEIWTKSEMVVFSDQTITAMA